MPSDEVIFVLNRKTEKKAVSFNWAKTNYAIKYIVPRGLIKIAKTVNASFVIPTSNGLADARNQGVAFAKNEIVALTDEDTILVDNWANTVRHNFKMRNADFIFGPMIISNCSSILEWWRNEYESVFSTRNVLLKNCQIGANNFISCAGRNIAVKRSSFIAVGGYNPKFNHLLGEDLDLEIRFVEQKYKVFFVKNMGAKHLHPIWLLGVLNKFWIGGKSDANWVRFNNHKIGLRKLSRNYVSPLKQIAFVLAIVVFLINFIYALFVVLIASLSMMLNMKRRPKPLFVMLSLVLMPVKFILANIAFWYQFIKQSETL
ncbi:MAG: glycosyltransferase family 2 protein [Candidatus Izemoplasmatales bacterium]